MKQQAIYNSEERAVWKTLFDRQIENLADKACAEYLNALAEMHSVLHPNDVARFEQLDKWFEQKTGWTIYHVPGLIPVDEFFVLLAEKRFPSSSWLRRMDQLDYLEEPDMFHDIFGHVPLLSNPVFSDFMQAFGKLGSEFLHDEHKLVQLQRLYWFTIEFGLIEQNGLKIYGAGIASSYGESISSLEGPAEKVQFDIDQVLATPFKNDEVQNRYFVIDSFETLFEALEGVAGNWREEAVSIPGN